ncbi:MAG: ABC transporter permease [Bacteroidales bacterium]|nr:ABC transporter permease [Bacteroidales bacterium]
MTYKKITFESSKGKSITLALSKVWKYRALILAFAVRDIRTQYAQTKLGIVWSFIQAITAALIINFFFGILIKIQIQNIPYILYAFPGMMAWYYFSYIVNYSGTSLVQSQHIINKMYFPKLILPLYKTLVGLIEFLIWFVFFLIMLILYSHPISVNAVLLPFCILLNIITGLSIAIWLSAITIRYRDVFHIIPYVVGFGIFVTPVFFETAMIPQAYHFLIYFNPMAGVIACYRWCLLDMYLSVNYLLGIIPVFLLFLSGLYYFRRVEGKIADII